MGLYVFNWPISVLGDWNVTYSSCHYHHQIGSIHISHCYHIFPWLCAWDVCYIIFCHLLHMRSGKTGNLFSFLLCSLWWVQIFGYVLACRTYSFVCTIHHLIIIIVQTYLKALNLKKMPVRYTLSSVWVRLGRFSPLTNIQYVGLYFFSLSISLVMIERIYILCIIIIIKSEVWTITHCLGLGHETIVFAVCISIFFKVIMNRMSWQNQITITQLNSLCIYIVVIY